MDQVTIDLPREQQASLARPRYRYSIAARGFFLSMDVLTGVRTTLPKAKLVELLASVPYRAWEHRQYARMTWHYRDRAAVERARAITAWAREAQDNEYWHLLVLNEKMKEDGVGDPRYLAAPILFFMVTVYRLLTWAMALVDIRRAFLFNAEFEDHAEHVYAKLVADHPEWERQGVTSEVVRRYGEQATWADVFRRVGLDERDHMNMSFLLAGRPEHVATYVGMPASHDPAVWHAGDGPEADAGAERTPAR
jgi:hypothetical protein